MKTQVIYIPGLGDGYDGFRRFGLQLLKLWGVDAQLVPMVWYDKKPLDTKLQTIEAAITKATNEGNSVTLVGESAGGAAALIAAAKFDGVSKIVTLCGVAQPDTPIASSLRMRAPALDQAVKALASNTIEPTIKVISVKAFFDLTVNTPYSIAPKAKVHTLPWIGHITAIAAALTIFSPFIASLCKK